jgi:hypothetical protein
MECACHEIALFLRSSLLAMPAPGLPRGPVRRPASSPQLTAWYLARGPVYRDCAVDRRARLLTTNGRPQFQPPTPPLAGTACYSAQIEVVVDSAGVPELETVRVVRANDPAFADAVLASLPRWRYQPALKSGVAVRQVVRETQTIAVEVVLVRAGETPRPRRALPC